MSFQGVDGRGPARLSLSLAVAFLGGGCATGQGLRDGPRPGQEPWPVYCGTYRAFDDEVHGFRDAWRLGLWGWLVYPSAVLDAPLSFVADTVLLPATLPIAVTEPEWKTSARDSFLSPRRQPLGDFAAAVSGDLASRHLTILVEEVGPERLRMVAARRNGNRVMFHELEGGYGRPGGYRVSLTTRVEERPDSGRNDVDLIWRPLPDAGPLPSLFRAHRELLTGIKGRNR